MEERIIPMAEDERTDFFRGDLDECLEHFVQKLILPLGKLEQMERRQQIAEFCSVTPRAVDNWLKQKMTPVGASLIKLECFLAMIGYSIIEWERTSSTLKGFAELIGFGLMDVGEAIKQVGFENSTSLYYVLNERRGISEPKRQLMWEIWKSRKNELDQVKKDCLERYRRIFVLNNLWIEEMDLVIPKDRSAVLYLMKALMVLLERQSIEDLIKSETELQEEPELVVKLAARLKVLDIRLKDRIRGDGR